VHPLEIARSGVTLAQILSRFAVLEVLKGSQAKELWPYRLSRFQQAFARLASQSASGRCPCPEAEMRPSIGSGCGTRLTLKESRLELSDSETAAGIAYESASIFGDGKESSMSIPKMSWPLMRPEETEA
jgi:hypothetical protein